MPAWLPWPVTVLTLFLHLFVYGGECMPQHVSGGQKTTFESQFSLSTTWVLGTKLRSSSLAATTLSHLPKPINSHNLKILV